MNNMEKIIQQLALKIAQLEVMNAELTVALQENMKEVSADESGE